MGPAGLPEEAGTQEGPLGAHAPTRPGLPPVLTPSSATRDHVLAARLPARALALGCEGPAQPASAGSGEPLRKASWPPHPVLPACPAPHWLAGKASQLRAVPANPWASRLWGPVTSHGLSGWTGAAGARARALNADTSPLEDAGPCCPCLRLRGAWQGQSLAEGAPAQGPRAQLLPPRAARPRRSQSVLPALCLHQEAAGLRPGWCSGHGTAG